MKRAEISKRCPCGGEVVFQVDPNQNQSFITFSHDSVPVDAAAALHGKMEKCNRCGGVYEAKLATKGPVSMKILKSK